MVRAQASQDPYYLGSAVARILVGAITLGMLAHVSHAGGVVLELMGPRFETGDWFSGTHLGSDWLFWGWGLSILVAVPLWLCWSIQGQLVGVRYEGGAFSWSRFMLHLVAGGAAFAVLGASFGTVFGFRFTGRWPLEDGDLQAMVVPALLHAGLALVAARVIAQGDRVLRWQTRLEPRPVLF